MSSARLPRSVEPREGPDSAEGVPVSNTLQTMEAPAPPSSDSLAPFFSILLLLFAACGLWWCLGRCCATPLVDHRGELTPTGHRKLGEAKWGGLFAALNGSGTPPTVGRALQFLGASLLVPPKPPSERAGSLPRVPQPPPAVEQKLSAPMNYYPLGTRLSPNALKTYGAGLVLSVINFLAL